MEQNAWPCLGKEPPCRNNFNFFLKMTSISVEQVPQQFTTVHNSSQQFTTVHCFTLGSLRATAGWRSLTQAERGRRKLQEAEDGSWQRQKKAEGSWKRSKKQKEAWERSFRSFCKLSQTLTTLFQLSDINEWKSGASRSCLDRFQTEREGGAETI